LLRPHNSRTLQHARGALTTMPACITLSSLPAVTPPSSFSTAGSVVKTGLGLAVVAASYVLETYGTLKLADKVGALLGYKSSPHGLSFLKPYLQCSRLQLLVYTWQLLSFVLAPALLRLDGRAWPDSDSAKAAKVWSDATPLRSLPAVSYDGGQALAWGLIGKFFFAPAIWKMAWAGKTVYAADSVSMLEFRELNKVPVGVRYSLWPLGKAAVRRSVVDGKESMAFCYQFMPVVDHLRRVDANTIVGKMMIGNICVLYFTLKTTENLD
jgi:hypothetical protein